MVFLNVICKKSFHSSASYFTAQISKFKNNYYEKTEELFSKDQSLKHSSQIYSFIKQSKGNVVSERKDIALTLVSFDKNKKSLNFYA
jgi:hypothetical protein